MAQSPKRKARNSELSNAARETPSNLKFLADGMLGSFCTKLRMVGYDTLYDKQSSDGELIELARREGRVLLTSDQELFRRASRLVSCVLISEKSDLGRLRELFSSLKLSGKDKRRSRCSLCNGELIQTKQDRLGRLVYQCQDCKKEYWKGSHWDNFQKTLDRVNSSRIENQKVA